WSTRESIDNDVLSVTAIIETVIAILLYWWIAIKFETYLPLLFNLAIAPLLLLRSDESIRLGVKLFMSWENGLDGRWPMAHLQGLVAIDAAMATLLIVTATAIQWQVLVFLCLLQAASLIVAAVILTKRVDPKRRAALSRFGVTVPLVLFYLIAQ